VAHGGGAGPSPSLTPGHPRAPSEYPNNWLPARFVASQAFALTLSSHSHFRYDLGDGERLLDYCYERASGIGGKEPIVSHPVLKLELPEDIYERVRRAAKGMNQPVEQALVNIVRAATPSLGKVPAECRAELEAMEDLGDEELRRISQHPPAPAQQRRLERLLDRNQRGELTDREKQALERLRADGDRSMLRRSYAVLLLKYRGHHPPNLEDL
jgi:hypothetical protein